MRDDNPGSHPLIGQAGEPPRPDPAFHWVRESWGFVLRCGALDSVAQHAFTSRQLALPADASPDDSARAWSRVASSVGVAPDRLMRIRQVHGNIVRVVARDAAMAQATVDRPDADAVVSNLPGAALAVLVADCVPMLIVDAVSGAAAAVHAGWRGTCARVAPAAVNAMARGFGSRPVDLVVALGPSIGPDDYEVGENVRDEFVAAGHEASAIARWFRRDPDGQRWRLDLWRANRDQLEAAGLRPAAIVDAALSTPRHPEWLESFRRDGARAGRMAAVVVVPVGRGA